MGDKNIVAKNDELSSSQMLWLYQHEGFWYPDLFFEGVLKAKDLNPTADLCLSPSRDVLLCSSPKSGTTWLKALAFSIVMRKKFDPRSIDHPILTTFPHDLIDFLETHDKPRDPEVPLLSTHIPYSALPEWISGPAGCKIVYIYRNPKDYVVSLWHFLHKVVPSGESVVDLDKTVGLFSQGISSYGPYWNHVLEYWKASLNQPERVLFLKYDDMMEDVGPHVRNLARFMGYPFSEEEEREGIPTKITDICNFGVMSNLKVNCSTNCHLPSKAAIGKVSNSSMFRKANIGDWRNYMTDNMVEKLDAVFSRNLSGSGLTI